MRRCLVIVVGLGFGAVARATDLDGAFAADGLRPATSGTTTLVTETRALPVSFDGRATLSGTWHPLVGYGADGEPQVLIQSMAVLHASAAVRAGPTSLAVSAPLALVLAAEGLDEPAAAAGDPRFSALISPQADRKSGLALSLAATLPLSGSDLWVGATGPTLEGWLIGDARLGKLGLAANVGVIAAKAAPLTFPAVDGPELGSRAQLRVASSYALREDLGLDAELLGGVALRERDPQSSPLELLVGIIRQKPNGFMAHLGVGFGILPGVGAPAARLLLTIGSRPGEAPVDEQPLEVREEETVDPPATPTERASGSAR